MLKAQKNLPKKGAFLYRKNQKKRIKYVFFDKKRTYLRLWLPKTNRNKPSTSCAKN